MVGFVVDVVLFLEVFEVGFEGGEGVVGEGVEVGVVVEFVEGV